MALSKIQRSAADAAVADLAACDLSTPEWIRKIARIRRGGSSEHFEVSQPLLGAIGYAQMCVSWGVSVARWGTHAVAWLREYAVCYATTAEWAMRFPAGAIGGTSPEIEAIRAEIEQTTIRVVPIVEGPVDRLARGPNPGDRVAPPSPGKRCPRCHRSSRQCNGPCLLCRPELVPAMFGGTKP